MSSHVCGYSIDEIESLICQINDIKAARVVVGPSQQIDEIHILANTTKNKGPKQISRDIESLLMASFGLHINHRIISIAQIGTSEFSSHNARPRLNSVKQELFENQAKFTIVLEHNGNEFEGIEVGPASKIGRIRLVAKATIRAIEKIVPDIYTFALEDIVVTSLGGDSAVITSIAVLGMGCDETYAGCALVKEDEREAIVRAVLDAVNRRLGFMIN